MRSEKPVKFYIQGLLSAECLCGRTKCEGKSFCFFCFKSLPINLQGALYKFVGDGYEEAYDASAEYLERVRSVLRRKSHA